jgi:hypothetical protein
LKNLNPKRLIEIFSSGSESDCETDGDSDGDMGIVINDCESDDDE